MRLDLTLPSYPVGAYNASTAYGVHHRDRSSTPCAPNPKITSPEFEHQVTLWNQLHIYFVNLALQSCLDSPPHPLVNSSNHPGSRLSSSITHSLFHPRLKSFKTYLFNKSFPP